MKPTHDLLSEAHHLMAKVIVYGLVPLHVLGALKHQFIDKDNTLARMIPFLARKDAA
jgi:cytochrome b561